MTEAEILPSGSGEREETLLKRLGTGAGMITIGTVAEMGAQHMLSSSTPGHLTPELVAGSAMAAFGLIGVAGGMVLPFEKVIRKETGEGVIEVQDGTDSKKEPDALGYAVAAAVLSGVGAWGLEAATVGRAENHDVASQVEFHVGGVAVMAATFAFVMAIKKVLGR